MSLAACAALLSSCAGTVDEPEGSPERVLIGTGQSEYEPLDGVTELPLVPGLQGGYHVWASFRAYGFVGDRLRMAIATEWGEDGEHRWPSELWIRVREVVDDEGMVALEAAGYTAQIQNPRCAHGARLDLTLELRDEAGHRASDARSVTAVLQEEPPGDCP